MWWLGFEANLPGSWSAAALLQSGTYTAPPIRFLNKCQTSPNSSLLLYTLCMFWYCHSIESQGLFTCARATRILVAASIRERRLFHSARPVVSPAYAITWIPNIWRENTSSKNWAASDFRPTSTSTRLLLKQAALLSTPPAPPPKRGQKPNFGTSFLITSTSSLQPICNN